MLINAQRQEELRLAIVSGNVLENYKVEYSESGLTRGNIYRGVIANIQPSLNAAFIDYGAERQGFLAIQDVVPEAFYKNPPSAHPRIEDVLSKGKPIVVQVTKDAVGTKGAALTTSLSLAGRYIVLTPFDDTRGVSRKVEDEDTRRKLKQIAHGFDLPQGCGIIVRTAALEQTKMTLNRDLAALLRLWKKVQTAASTGKGTHLLYTDQDLILQSLRDYLDASIEEVLIDDPEVFQKAEAYMRAFMPRSKTRLTHYSERLPLFTKHGLEAQIDRIYERRVELPAGGSIVIDATEALTAIDVNSGRSTRAASQEETALHTNLEAAAEVARQLRLRDLGGLVVVDFIDMRASKNQRKVEKALKDALKADKARSTVGRISPNGLLEINRQRIQQALQMRTHRTCPTCNGVGRLASEEMVSLSLLRRIEARAASGSIQGVHVALHPELADSFQNGYRRELAALESEFDLEIEVIASPGLHRPDEEIEWVKRERPLPQPKKRPMQPTLQPWDLALVEGEEDFEDDEEDEGGTVAAGSAAPHDEQGTAADGSAKRKRRRRSRHKKGRGGENGVHAEGEGQQSALPYPPPDPSAPLAFRKPYDVEDDDEPDSGLEALEGDAGEAPIEGDEGAAGGPRRKKRRGGRGGRRRKKANGAAGPVAEGAPGASRGSTAQEGLAPASHDAGHPLSDDDGDEDEDDDEGQDLVEAGGEPAGDGTAPVAKRRRRRGGRKRRKVGSQETAGGVAAAVDSEPGATAEPPIPWEPPARPEPAVQPEPPRHEVGSGWSGEPDFD
jgi:ribonuclease E